MKENLRLLTEVTLIALAVVMYGLVGTGLMLTLIALAGELVGLTAGFIYVVLTMFIWIKIDERRTYLGP